MVKSNRHEAHYRIFHIPLFLPPSHIKYSPIHPGTTNPQFVFLSSHNRPNFTHTQNNRNNVSRRTRNILHWTVGNIGWTCCFYRPKITVLLMFCQDLTCLNPDLQQSGSATSQATCHKCKLFKFRSPQSYSFHKYRLPKKQEILYIC